MAEHKMEGGGEGTAILNLVEIHAAEAMQRVDVLGGKLDGHHQAAIALAAAVTALARGVRGALKHGESPEKAISIISMETAVRRETNRKRERTRDCLRARVSRLSRFSRNSCENGPS